MSRTHTASRRSAPRPGPTETPVHARVSATWEVSACAIAELMPALRAPAADDLHLVVSVDVEAPAQPHGEWPNGAPVRSTWRGTARLMHPTGWSHELTEVRAGGVDASIFSSGGFTHAEAPGFLAATVEIEPGTGGLRWATTSVLAALSIPGGRWQLVDVTVRVA